MDGEKPWKRLLLGESVTLGIMDAHRLEVQLKAFTFAWQKSEPFQFENGKWGYTYSRVS